jgi:hypothetical protein
MPDQHRKRLMQMQPRQRSHQYVRTDQSDSSPEREIKQSDLKRSKLVQCVPLADKSLPILEPPDRGTVLVKCDYGKNKWT